MNLNENKDNEPPMDQDISEFVDEEDEKTKKIFQTLVDFDQEINDLTILSTILKNISEYSNNSPQIILNHPLFLQTNLIDHLLALISDPDFPPSLKILSINCITPFIPLFAEEQVNAFLDLPFFPVIFELFVFYYDKSDNKIDGLCLAKILRFLSNLSRGSPQARDEVILQLTVNGEFESFDSKAIEVFNKIEYTIKSGDVRNQIEPFLIFFKSLCYYPLSQNVYEVVCLLSLNLIKQLPNEKNEHLIKLNWYIIKNGFIEIVSSKPDFFNVFLSPSFFTKSSLRSLKCFSKIIKSMIEFDLSKSLDFKLIVFCITKLNVERSIIILKLIDFLISNDNDSNSDDDEKNELLDELKTVYLDFFIGNQLLYQLKKVLSSELFTIDHKIVSLKILRTIVFKNNPLFIFDVVKKKFIKPLFDLIELHELLICEFVVKILIFLMNASMNNQLIFSIVSQIREVNGYQSLLTLIDDIEATDESEIKGDSSFEEIYQISKEIISLIDSFEEENQNKKQPNMNSNLLGDDEEENNDENEPEWLAQWDLFFESIFPEKVGEEEEEEAEDEDELEQREFDIIKKIEKIIISIPIEDEGENEKNENENENDDDEDEDEEKRRTSEINFIKSKEIFASILEDYEKKDLERGDEEEEDFYYL